MNIKHLLDALDCWKSWMLDAIPREDRILKIVPMFTDAGAWTDDHHALYAGLLHSDPKHILNAKVTFKHEGRDAYFRVTQSLPNEVDVFVDPDNGPWTGKASKNAHRYVTACELISMLPATGSRVVFVYRHESRCQTILGLQSYIAERFKGESGWTALGILCGVTTLICLSRDADRLLRIRTKLISNFHPIGPQRITDIVKS